MSRRRQLLPGRIGLHSSTSLFEGKHYRAGIIWVFRQGGCFLLFLGVEYGADQLFLIYIANTRQIMNQFRHILPLQAGKQRFAVLGIVVHPLEQFLHLIRHTAGYDREGMSDFAVDGGKKLPVLDGIYMLHHLIKSIGIVDEGILLFCAGWQREVAVIGQGCRLDCKILDFRQVGSVLYIDAGTDTAFMEEPIRRAEKRYALLEYLNLKQGVSRERLFDLLTELNEEDVLLTKQLREQLTSHGGTTAESDEKERGKEMVSVKQTVNDVVASLTMLEGRSEGTIAEETLLREELGFDSLKMVELVVSLEEAFAIQIDEADLDPQAFDTVGDLYRLGDQYLAC